MGLFDFIRRRQSLMECGVLAGVIDRHSHILFGVDDGIKTLEDSLEVLAFAEEAGVKEVWCTPHIMEDVPNTSEMLRERFSCLVDSYKGPINLYLAAEYMMDTLFEQRLEKRDLLVMEEDMVLVETSTWNPPSDMTGMLRRLQQAGYRPLLAHPERYRYLDVAGYESLLRQGVLFQLNLGSIVGNYGETAMKKAQILLKRGCYSEIGSDCHRLTSIKKQYYREELTKDVISELSSLLKPKNLVAG